MVQLLDERRSRPEEVIYGGLDSVSRVRIAFKNDLDDPDNGVFVFEIPDYPGVMILPPYYTWDKNTPPPAGDLGHAIGEGNGIFMISYTISAEVSKETGIPQGVQVVYQGGQWVALDGTTVAGRINEKGKWEKVVTTDWSKLSFTPSSHEEISINNMLLSPQYGTPEFDAWMDEVTRRIMSQNPGATFSFDGETMNPGRGVKDYKDVLFNDKWLGTFLLKAGDFNFAAFIFSNGTRPFVLVLPPSTCLYDGLTLCDPNPLEMINGGSAHLFRLIRSSGGAWDSLTGEGCTEIKQIIRNSIDTDKLYYPLEAGEKIPIFVGFLKR